MCGATGDSGQVCQNRPFLEAISAAAYVRHLWPLRKACGDAAGVGGQPAFAQQSLRYGNGRHVEWCALMISDDFLARFKAATEDKWRRASIDRAIYGFQILPGTRWNPGLPEDAIRAYQEALG